MSLKVPSVSNPEQKLIKCKTCRQDIASEKMFLHEGFCQRNNIFCEHCEKVFLKKDYEEHLKDLRNSINSAKSTDIDENEYPIMPPVIIPTVTTTINPSTIFEFVEMPLTEEYKINSPIVISESGNIVSYQNTNEFILPSLGINAIHHDEFVNDYEKYFNSISNTKSIINYDNNNNEVYYNQININSSNINNNYYYVNSNNYNINQDVFHSNNNNLNNFFQNNIEKKKKKPQKEKPKKEPIDSPKSSRPKRQIDIKKNKFPQDTPSRERNVKIIKFEKKESIKSPIRLPKNRKIQRITQLSPRISKEKLSFN